ncbi:unnamed protein product [Arabidopsis thaliana]|uniref:Fatty acyl-CoA reductase n=1 Tax=Arabidopsis thaliana TaxID=3702 RepID=A0A7G2F9C1_ARATH|nr:unnamed protein product [Arabidopsis thaliana]
MEPNCVQFLENRTILVTGASGFLAKVLVERILRLQPNVKRLYLLVRASDKKSAEQRLHREVFEKELFRVLRRNVGDESLNALISEKVVPVPGDISLTDIGVHDSNLLQDMMQDIDIIISSAATTRFDERYDVALGINTFGAINVLNFAKKCVKPKLLLHVSTAYVCGERPGHIVEKHFAMGESLNGKNKVDINTERRLADQKSKQLKEQGQDFMGGQTHMSSPKQWEKCFLDTIEKLCQLTVDSVIIFYGKGILKCFLVDQKTVCDIIPVDMVVNAMIAIAADHCHDSGSHTVYHVGSSNQNPVIYKQIYEMMSRYFMKSPLVGRNGMLIVPKVTTISTLARFRVYTNLRYKLPIQILGLLSVISPSQRDKFALHNRKFKMAMRLVKLYKPYVLFKGIFDDKNMGTLRIKNEAKDMEKLFGTNPKCIDWEDYFMNTHIPGLMTHVFKK